jgi:hypothetical protein
MKLSEELDKVIIRYFNDLITKFNFVLYEDFTSGMGALKKYENDHLKIQFVNDRGLINLDISPLYRNEDFRDLEIIYAYISCNFLSEKEKAQIHKSNILTKRLDFENQSNFLIENWNTVIYIFNKSNYKETIKCIDELGSQRFDMMINK